mgnify:CR=1 FL=1
MTKAKVDSSDCSIAGLIDSAIQKQEAAQPPRQHLGASSIGQKCERKTWLEFRWAIKREFPGRILRLFRRGHSEEQTVLSDLRLAGFTVLERDPETGRQFAFKEGHFAGSCDGIIANGPGIASPALLEVKTHNADSFAKLVKHGVKASHPTHYAQMQVYMAAFGLTQAMYFAVCKDDDTIHTEMVDFDPVAADTLKTKAQRIISDQVPPPPISTDPTWYECKMCNAHHDMCHCSKLTKQVNCRTCAHSTPELDGTWHCAHWNATIPTVEAQIAGCDSHLLHPDLVPFQVQVRHERIIWITPHGEIDTAKYKSREIVANAKACAMGLRDRFTQFNPEIVG